MSIKPARILTEYKKKNIQIPGHRPANSDFKFLRGYIEQKKKLIKKEILKEKTGSDTTTSQPEDLPNTNSRTDAKLNVLMYVVLNVCVAIATFV